MRPSAATPADTRTMGIVHDALRRDLGRALDALSTAPFPHGARRTAIGEHVDWMMTFLAAHHAGEEAGLWPLVRDRDPRAGPLLDTMHADHERVAPQIDACRAAAREYGTGTDETRAALVDALHRLSEVLLPHLEREEEELMPLVSISISLAEWRAVDQEYFVRPKSLTQLGFEGHWLLDNLDPERARLVVHQVPPVPRFVLVHGFARRYQRRAEACWGPADTSDGGIRPQPYGPVPAPAPTIPRTGRVDTVVPAPIDAVWTVVTDVTRVGEWSHECRRVEWLDGADRAAPGARFRGTNKAGPWTWSRVNEVLVADEPHTFAWRTIPTALFPDSTEWRIELEPVDGGTRITQSFDVVRAPAVLARLYAVAVPTHRERRSGLTDDLHRLGELARADVASSPTSREPVRR